METTSFGAYGGGATPPPSLPRLTAPTQIGRYIVTREIGRGGMGIVLAATDPVLEREVAIKMLLDPTRQGEAGQRRLAREARAIARLRHPGLVAVHEVGAHGGHPYLVMDYVEGEALDDVLERERLAPRRTAEIVRNVALGLQHAHEHGVVHRDIKPGNVLLDQEGRPRLVDFGLAHDVGGAENLTATGLMVGTPAYMAPEQASGSHAQIGPATDVWGLGGLLYHCLVGRSPFRAEPGSGPFGLVRKIIHEDPDRPSGIDPHTPVDLETIALRCLEKEPRRRYASAGEVAEELRRWLDSEPITARARGPVERLVRWTRRNPAATAALIVLGLAVFAAIALPAIATSRQRRTLIDAARAEAREALERARAEGERAAATDVPAAVARQRFGRRLGAALDAVAAAERWASLAPGDAAATAARCDALLALGDVAADAEQWEVAEEAVARAKKAGLSDEQAGAATARLTAARERAIAGKRALVEKVLDRARAGALAQDAAYEDALFELVRLGDVHTARQIGEALDAVSARLDEVTAELLREVVEPSAAESRAGEGRLDGLDRILARRRTLAPAEVIAGEDAQVLGAAIARFEHRNHDQTGLPGQTVLAAAQAARIDPALRRTARLCCDSLARIGLVEPALAPLWRYLIVEEDEVRAAVAGIAIGRLGGPLAERCLIAARESLFDANGTFWDRVSRALMRRPGEGAAAVELGDVGEDATAEQLIARAQVVAARAEDGRAIELFARAIAIAQDPTQLSAAHHGRGNSLNVLGRHAEAIADLTRAIELWPEGAAASYCARGLARHALGQTELALADLSKAIELDPSTAALRGNRGVVLSEVGDLEGAFRDFSNAIELDPRSPMHWTNRGQIHIALNRLPEAIADLTAALRTDDRFRDAWSGRGEARLRLGEYEAAIADFDRAIALDPRDSSTWNNRAVTREQLRDLEGALRDYARSLELDPDDVVTLFNRGRVLLQKGEAEAALSDLLRAVRDAPDDVDVLIELGRCRIALGDPAAAIPHLERAVQVAPDPEIAAEAQALLAQARGD